MRVGRTMRCCNGDAAGDTQYHLGGAILLLRGDITTPGYYRNATGDVLLVQTVHNSARRFLENIFVLPRKTGLLFL